VIVQDDIKHRLSKVVDIIEQEKGKYRFHIGSLCGRDEDERRCTIGLLMSHFGWNGSREISYSFEHANKKVNELLRSSELGYILDINDSSSSFDEVQQKLTSDIGDTREVRCLEK
jgi:hypothetical protein